MNITRFTDYSLRVLIYLALSDEAPVTIKEVAERYKISKNHLMKVVQDLSAKGFVDAIRGKNGGIKLNMPAEEISLGAVVRSIEEDSALVECFSSDNTCIITSACRLKGIFAEAMEDFFSRLDNYTLADLLAGEKGKQLPELLSIEVQRVN